MLLLLLLFPMNGSCSACLDISTEFPNRVMNRPLRTSRPNQEKIKERTYQIMNNLRALPHWDLSGIFPGIDSAAFTNDFSRVIQQIDELAQLFDTYHIEEQRAALLNDQTVQAFEVVIER